MILFAIYCLFYPFINAVFNNFVIRYGRHNEPIEHRRIDSRAWHTVQSVEYSVNILAVCFFAYSLDIDSLWQSLSLAFVGISMRWVLFDIILNKMLGNDWNYIGGTVCIDKWFKNHSHLWLPSKILCLVICVALWIFVYNSIPIFYD